MRCCRSRGTRRFRGFAADAVEGFYIPVLPSMGVIAWTPCEVTSFMI